MKTRTISRLAVSALTTALLVACGGGSSSGEDSTGDETVMQNGAPLSDDNGEPSETDPNPDPDTGGNTDTPTGDPDVAADPDVLPVVPPSADSTPSAYGTPSMSNGYSLVSSSVTSASSTRDVEFVVDTSFNTITPSRFYPQMNYDDQGRASFGEFLKIEYNDDGTPAVLTRSFIDSQVQEITRYTYTNGRVIKREFATRIDNGIGSSDPEPEDPVNEFTVNYAENGVLLSVDAKFSFWDAPRRAADYTLNDAGLITEVLEYIDYKQNQPLRHVLTYDKNNNLTLHEIYSSDGALRLSRSYAYTVATEKMPNFMGVYMNLNRLFLPED